ncbi:MAG: hypothetical protein ACREBQ_12945, partial [Nitrososphaerales archaeon]
AYKNKTCHAGQTKSNYILHVACPPRRFSRAKAREQNACHSRANFEESQNLNQISGLELKGSEKLAPHLLVPELEKSSCSYG